MAKGIAIEMTWGKLLAGIGSLITVAGVVIGSAWLIVSAVFGSVETDVASIRDTLPQLTGEDLTIRTEVFTVDLSLQRQIGEIHTLSEVNAVSLKNIGGDIGEMRTDVRLMRGDIAGLRKDFGGVQGEISGLRTDFGGLREEMSGLRENFRAAFGPRITPQQQ